MDKLTRGFLQQVQQLQNTLSQLLEKPSAPKTPGDVRAFEITTDISQLSDLGKQVRGMNDREAVLAAFQRLTPYFEAGLLLEIHPSGSRPTAAFRLGQMHPLLPEDRDLTWNTPQFAFAEIKILKSESLKKDFEKLGFFDPALEEVLAFRILPDWMILVVSRLPKVFLKHHTSQIHLQLMKVFAEVDRE